MKQLTITLLAGLGLLAASCEKDNITPPTSMLTGRVTFQNQGLNVRGGGSVQLELWQRGEFNRTKIPIYLAQDGTYSAALFDGEYKLTRLRDNGPWANNTDSITVQVKGNTVVDVPVQPYFTIGAATIAKSGSNVTANFPITKVGTRDIQSATLYLGYTQFVDVSNQFKSADKFATDLTNLSQPVNLSVALPTNYSGPIYARVGVRTNGVGELIYSPVQKIQ
ncbi:MAG TPA: DUF3823 domain-containing protein [Hymenobacter sp.]|uniref:DUF3823 domain-containing protein n=1 Tax=Hymenobacter sp. TaxID=1898978 RepID=UPI002D7FF427|nr:DUF3823 domain-containing protein [Hymenobacter sp.]HET9504390.1 DUF3823 domain-containing protein [Hymenobacter sp.]